MSQNVMYLTYATLKSLAAHWDSLEAEEDIRRDCWKAIPDLINAIESDLTQIFNCKIFTSTVNLSVGNEYVQGATVISLGFLTDNGNRTWLTVNCLPDFGRVMLLPNCEPENVEYIQGYRKILDNSSPGLLQIELASINP